MRYQKGSRGFTMLEILVVVLIIGALAALVVTPMLSGRRTKEGQRVMSPPERARGVECMSYLSQVRQAITMYQTSNDRLPASIQDLRSYGVAETLTRCPDAASRSPYQYDPATGQVRCLTEGHERY